MLLALCRPALAQTTPLQAASDLLTVPLEIDGGKLWERQVDLPSLGPDETPVLFVRARIPFGGGGNFIMRVLIDGAPLRDNWFAPRLLNKPPNFDPPNTQYHFQWYRDTSWGNFSYTWFTVFGPDPQGNWAGTGQDFDYLFSLGGLVSGQSFKLGIEHVFPGLAAALKIERAPLLVEKLSVGKLPNADVERLRRNVLGGMAIQDCPVNPQVPAGETGEVAYELQWSKRPAPASQVTFDKLQGWTCQSLGDATVSLSASVQQRLWRPAVGRLDISKGEKPLQIVLRPPQPIRIDNACDAANFWVYGAMHFMQPTAVTFNAVALLADAKGGESIIDLGPIRMGYWMLLHGNVAGKPLQPPMFFKALLLSCPAPKDDYKLYLESVHFYSRNRHPRPQPRPKDAVFPVSDTGMAPTLPAGVKTSVEKLPQSVQFVSSGPGGRLVYEVAPERGCLEGVMTRWNDGIPFQPCAGGGVEAAETGPVAAGKLLGWKLQRDRLTADWQTPEGQKFSAEYALRGRTLTVNLRAPGGWATGTAWGELAGLPKPRGLEVPYMKLSQAKKQSLIAVAGDLFISVLPDIYRSDYSIFDGTAGEPKDDRLALAKHTMYTPLTDGRRNDVNDCVLITVSPEFADTLPNHQNPRSPSLERLAPQMFIMDRLFSLNRWDTLKRYGMDHIIANDFAGMFVKSYSEGFGLRWRPHPSYTIKQVQDARQQVKDLGFWFGAYIDETDFYPLNEFWDEDLICLTSTGDLAEAWPGSYATRPDMMWVLARQVGQKMKELYPPDCVYLDVTTNRGVVAMNYEAGLPGSGMARSTIVGVGDSLVETRKWYGSTVSEGIYRWWYAGLADMDYAQLHMADPMPLPLDFDLLKLHPYAIGTMMGYGPTNLLSPDEIKDLNSGAIPGPQAFYKWVATSLAYGHMAMLGYGYFPPMSRFIQHYALMQGVQQEYLADTVSRIEYHDGERFLNTSAALQQDAHKRGRVRVTYKGGLVVTVNLNPEQDWTVSQAGQEYVLPPYGWVITKDSPSITAYSALIAGKRMDYVQCPEYVYLNGGELPRRVGPLEVQGAAWLKREGNGWLLIPCGKLGYWSPEQRIDRIPADRGTPLLIVDLKALGLKTPQITGLGEMGDGKWIEGSNLADGRVRITASDSVRAYRIQ
jgi:hypothetical protein